MTATEPEFVPEDYEGLNPALKTIHPAELRKLRKQANEAEELRNRIADMERRQVFVEAGIPTTGLGAYFIKGYEGPLDVESIRTRAVQDGLLPATPSDPTEVAGHQNAMSMASGATPPNAGPDFAARLAELGQKTFAPADDVARQEHIREIARLAKEAGATLPIYPGN